MSLPITLLTVNANTGKIVSTSTLKEPLYSARPRLVDGRQRVLGISFVDDAGVAVALGAADTFQLAVDSDFVHTCDTGAANAGYSGAVTSIVVKGLTSASIPSTGFIVLTNGAGQSDRVAYTAKSGTVPGNITFTVSATLTYVYLTDNVITVEDELMLFADVDQFDIAGDWADISRANGKVSCRINANTTAFTRKLAALTELKVYLEISRFTSGDPNPAIAVQDYGYAVPAVRGGEGEPGETGPDYFTAAQTLALLGAAATETVPAADIALGGGFAWVKTITADTTITVSGAEAGQAKHALIEYTASGATRNLTLPAGLVWWGLRPTANIIAIPDGSTAVIQLISIGTTIYAAGGVAGVANNYMINPMSAAADLIVGGASGAATRLAKGAAYQYLRMNSGATAEEWADLMTAAGDTMYGGTAGVPTRLAKGTAGQGLRMNAGATAPEWAANKVAFCVPCSDETTAVTTGTAKVTFRMPFAMKLTALRLGLGTAATGATLLTVDVNEAGTSILSTKLTTDDGEKTSVTAATPAVISDPDLANDAEMTVDFDAVGSTVAGAGVKLWFIGYEVI
jgi:hypothetical protein